MSRFVIRIAERNFAVEARYPEVEQLCADYRIGNDGTETDGIETVLTEAVFQVTDEDLRDERRRSAQEAVCEGRPIPFFTPGQLEVTAVLRKLAEHLSRNGGAVMHGVLLDCRGHGILFTAPSSTGKSTHAENWRKAVPDSRIINGDKPVILFRENQVTGYGTPWAGKEGIQVNASVPVEAVVFLHRAEENSISEIPFPRALPQLIGCIYRSSDGDGVKRAALAAAGFRSVVRFYSLGCNRNEDSARVAYRGIFNI